MPINVIPMRRSAQEKLTDQVKEVAAMATDRDKTLVEQIIERAKLGIRSSDVFVLTNVACALLYLLHNTHNREIVAAWAQELLRRRNCDMWKYNNATIGFYNDGTICDAQHRILAAALSNKPFETAVVFGIELGAVDTIDAGKHRSAASTAFLEGGIQNAAPKTAIVKRAAAYWTMQTGDRESFALRSETEQKDEVIANDETLRLALEIAEDARNDATAKCVTPSTAGFLAYLLLRGGYDEGFVHDEIVDAMSGSDKYSPAIVFLSDFKKKRKTITQLKEAGIFVLSITEGKKGNWVTGKHFGKAIEGKRLPDPTYYPPIAEAAE